MLWQLKCLTWFLISLLWNTNIWRNILEFVIIVPSYSSIYKWDYPYCFLSALLMNAEPQVNWESALALFCTYTFYLFIYLYFFNNLILGGGYLNPLETLKSVSWAELLLVCTHYWRKDNGIKNIISTFWFSCGMHKKNEINPSPKIDLNECSQISSITSRRKLKLMLQFSLY